MVLPFIFAQMLCCQGHVPTLMQIIGQLVQIIIINLFSRTTINLFLSWSIIFFFLANFQANVVKVLRAQQKSIEHQPHQDFWLKSPKTHLIPLRLQSVYFHHGSHKPRPSQNIETIQAPLWFTCCWPILVRANHLSDQNSSVLIGLCFWNICLEFEPYFHRWWKFLGPSCCMTKRLKSSLATLKWLNQNVVGQKDVISFWID